MRRVDGNSVTVEGLEVRSLPGPSLRVPHVFSVVAHLPYQRFLAAPGIVLVLIAAVACATGGGLAPAGAQDPSKPSEVTVPDDISALDSDEVERRLGRLLNGSLSSGQAAPGVAVNATPDDPTLDEILALLNAATPESGPSDIVISISPATLSGLANPILKIKTSPSHGTAAVIAPNQILYMPDGSGDGSDEFEYELLDGERLVVSQVIEIRK